ncbi:Holliday junction resolvase RuvX [Corynebacterium hansenii]|uniref:Putative pre-16S rRNA nuclease n=1 Tax=Corynebacterium hansenii TaxID=394964 RepID=A0ABV7ZQH2_9CORY|nr:Holliday junction resolvase RuvX [Corynebacterium hansenii]WJY99920.1 Putative Holliday junction resolvase [Corynebacterium hansenii]
MAKLEIDRPGADDPGRGRRLGIDVGDVRVGVAMSDPDGLLATPVETITRETGRRGPDGADIDRLVELAEELDVVEIVIGLPLMLDGTPGTSARKAGDVAFRLGRRLGGGVRIRMADERMTTVMAQSRLHQAGRDVKSGRSVIDQAAAVEILQSWLDQRRDFLRAAP